MNRRFLSQKILNFPKNELINYFKSKKEGCAVIVSKADQIHFNLALESYLTDVIRPQIPVFMWWRNDKNIVIGRHQNPWQECNLHLMKEHGVDLSRRFTGGGAVYQDLGNSCFTFLIPSSQSDISKNNQIILNTLKKHYNIEGQSTGRNDLLANGRKFSGAAFRTIKYPNCDDKESLNLHHGTILISVTMDALLKYLTPHKTKLQSKGISSVVSRVINLSELNSLISHENLEHHLIEEFIRVYGQNKNNLHSDFKPIIITQNHSIIYDEQYARLYNLLTDWSWRYGVTPKFSYSNEGRFDWGFIQLNFDFIEGKIINIKIFTDILDAELIPKLEAALIDTPYKPEAIQKKLFKVSLDYIPDSISHTIITDVTCWICANIQKD